MHILMNMFMLWMFGMVVENVWGPKKFLFYYMVCGIGAGLCQELAQYGAYVYDGLSQYNSIRISTDLVVPMETYLNMMTTVGASGAIYAVLLAFGMLFPEERMFIIPIPIPIKAKWIVLGSVGVELFSALGTSNDGCGSFSPFRWYALWFLADSLLEKASIFRLWRLRDE